MFATSSRNHEVLIQNIPIPNCNFGTQQNQNFASRPIEYEEYDASSRGNKFCLHVFGIPEEVPEEVLINIFSAYGTLISLEVFPRCNINPSYALLGYADALSAVAAMRSLDGKRVFTDKEELRIGWAKFGAATERHLNIQKPKKVRTSTHQEASVFVSFSGMRTNVTVNEDVLRRIFGRFGVLSEIAIRLSLIDKFTNVRKGYAFIRYEVNSNGVFAAVAAEKEVNNTIRDNVHYHVELSRVLANSLRSEGHLEADSRDSLDTACPMANSLQDDMHFPLETMPCGRGGRAFPIDNSEQMMIATRGTAAGATSPMNHSFPLPTTAGMMSSMNIPHPIAIGAAYGHPPHPSNHHQSMHYSEQYHQSHSHHSHHHPNPHNYFIQNQLNHNHGHGHEQQQHQQQQHSSSSISPSSSIASSLSSSFSPAVSPSTFSSCSSSTSSSYGGYVITRPATATTPHYQQY